MRGHIFRFFSKIVLDLPSHVKVHHVFHVSLLKKCVPNSQHVLQESCNLWDDGSLKVEPKLMLDGRVKQI